MKIFPRRIITRGVLDMATLQWDRSQEHSYVYEGPMALADSPALDVITRSITEIGEAAKAAGVKVDKQLGELTRVTGEQGARLLDVEQKLASSLKGAPGGGDPNAGRVNVAKSIADDDKMKLIRTGSAERIVIPVQQSLRAIVKSILTNTGQGGDSPNFNFPSAPQFVNPVPSQSPGRKLQVLQALPHQTVDGATAIVPKVESHSDGAAVQSVEGAMKGESTLNVIGAPMELPTIATYLNASKQLISDVAALPAFLNDWLLFFVLRKLENLILSGNGTTDKILGLVNGGIPYESSAQHGIDRVLSAAAVGLPAQGYTANLIILSTLDYFHTLSARDANERYVGPGWGMSMPGTLWGIQTVSSPGLPTGTALVLDTSRVAILDRAMAQIFVGWTGNQFVENAATILAELRANLAISDPEAVMVVTLPIDSPHEIG